MPNKSVLEQKQKEVKELADKFKKCNLILLTDYRGINVEDVSDLRNKLRKVKSDYKVIKNNITRRALQECALGGLEEQLLGPTAIITCEDDYSEPTKIIYKYSKNNEFYKIKGGVIEGKVMSADEIIALAKLPSRETLLGMLAGALLGNITKLAVSLDQVRVQKENA